jgi:hypothetical protein
LTRRMGDFARRGVQTSAGPIETPRIADMRCRYCRRQGVTLTGIDDSLKATGWCSFSHWRADMIDHWEQLAEWSYS